VGAQQAPTNAPSCGRDEVGLVFYDVSILDLHSDAISSQRPVSVPLAQPEPYVLETWATWSKWQSLSACSPVSPRPVQPQIEIDSKASLYQGMLKHLLTFPWVASSYPSFKTSYLAQLEIQTRCRQPGLEQMSLEVSVQDDVSKLYWA
jgi:hypothetical protein